MCLEKKRSEKVKNGCFLVEMELFVPKFFENIFNVMKIASF